MHSATQHGLAQLQQIGFGGNYSKILFAYDSTEVEI